MGKIEIDKLQLQEFFNGWLDTMLDIYDELLEEWETNNYVQEIPNAEVSFHCNDCGKCCQFTDHDVWIYAKDLANWLEKIDEEKYIALYISALLPVKDLDDLEGLGLPSQKKIVEVYNDIKKNIKDKTIGQTLTTIIKHLKIINPNFDTKSNFCIYYNPNPKKGTGHCCIYNNRPIQCRSYPYDYPQFTKFEIPNKTEKGLMNQLPLCPPITYVNKDLKKGVKTTEKQRKLVTMEKANYRSTSVVDIWANKSDDWKKIRDADIFDTILELFHSDVIYLNRELKILKNKSNKSDKDQRFVKGKRPSRNRNK